MDLIWTNPQEEIQPRGYVLISNPLRKEEDKESFIVEEEKEIVERWVWLVYKGKNPDGWRCPENRPEADWFPEPNCWRTATKEDMKIITDAIINDKAKHYKTVKESFEMASGEEKKKRTSYVEIPVSVTFIIPEYNMIVRKWRDGLDLESLGFGPELEEQANNVQKECDYINNLPKCIGEYKVEF